MALNVYYDTRQNPITFDFSYFLINAECYRQTIKVPAINLHIVSPSFRDVSIRDKEYDVPEKEWRLHHILGQLPKLLATVKSVNVQRYEIEHVNLPSYPPTYPYKVADKSSYLYYSPTVFRQLQEEGCEVQPFRASEHAKNLVRNFTRGHSYVTISLRTSNFQEARNSNVAAWHKCPASAPMELIRVIA